MKNVDLMGIDGLKPIPAGVTPVTKSTKVIIVSIMAMILIMATIVCRKEVGLAVGYAYCYAMNSGAIEVGNVSFEAPWYYLRTLENNKVTLFRYPYGGSVVVIRYFENADENDKFQKGIFSLYERARTTIYSKKYSVGSHVATEISVMG